MAESISFKEKTELFLFRFQKISSDEKIFFVKNLAVMIRSGLAFSHSLKILIQQTENKKFKYILEKIQGDIEGGSSLTNSLAEYPDVFSEVFVSMINAGEKSGQLEKILEEISVQMKKMRMITSKVKRALTYPAFVLTIMVLVAIFAIIFIIPKMMGIFSEMNVELPLLTRILIAISDFIIAKGHFLLIGILIVGLLLWRFSKTKKGKYFFHSLFLKMPIVGPLSKKINLIKFSRTFTSLLASDIPLSQTFEITSRVLNNVLYQEKVSQVASEITKGVTVASVLQKSPKLFPPIITQIVEIGEKTGTLENILEDIIQFYEDDLDEVLANLASIIEPVLIVIIGIGVALMALAIITPMYSLTTSM